MDTFEIEIDKCVNEVKKINDKMSYWSKINKELNKIKKNIKNDIFINKYNLYNSELYIKLNKIIYNGEFLFIDDNNIIYNNTYNIIGMLNISFDKFIKVYKNNNIEKYIEYF